MAKPVREVTTCEFCDRIIDVASPPKEEYYVQGQIHIHDGTVLLDRPDSAATHAAFLSGYYCDINCFDKKVAQLREKLEDYVSPETRKVIDENVYKLEVRGTQIWICLEESPTGLRWSPLADLEPVVAMLRKKTGEKT